MCDSVKEYRMKPVHFLFITLVGLTGAAAVAASASGSQSTGAAASSLLDHEVRRLDSDEVINLGEAFDGKVVLAVNTASRCAFTRQYEGLEALYATYRDRGLVILGFPSNDFAGQEPGSEAEIKDFCRLTYGVSFPMFAKTRVQEGAADQLFNALGEAAGRYPQWNFHKYLIARDGSLAGDFVSLVGPQSQTLVQAIEELL
jgi:glutathione peroxidase